MIDKHTTVTANEIILCLGVQKSQLADLVRKKIVTKANRGKYLLLESLNDHREWILAGSDAKDQNGNPIDYYAERARKTKAEADALERKNQIADGEYIAVTEVCSKISEATAICSKILGAFKIQLARIAPDMSNRTLDLIERESAKCVNALCTLDQSYIDKVDTVS